MSEPLITDLAFDVPISAVPYGSNWMGHWAILQEAADGLLQVVRSLDLKVHLQQHAAASSSPAAAGNAQVSAERIAVVFLEGVLMRHEASMMESTSMVRARRQIKNAAADDSVAAILIRITSPGGTVAGTGELAAAVAAAAAKKPVYAYCEDMCCSAAYWIGSQATKVFCNPTALVGSIGTYMAVADHSGAAAMDGVKVHVLRAGAFKGAGVKGTEISADHLAKWQEEVNALNEHFLAGVASGRRLSIEQVRAMADGRVHVGQAAADLKLVDAVSSPEDAIAQLLSHASGSKKMKGASMSATLQQLEDACPGASAEFLVGQLKAGATVEVASKAHVTQLVKDRDAANAAKSAAEQRATEATAAKDKADKEAAAAKEEAEKAKAAKKVGVDPVKTTKSGESKVDVDGDPIEAWDAAVEQLAAEKKLTKAKAVRQLAIEQPELHQAYIAAYTTANLAKVQRSRATSAA